MGDRDRRSGGSNRRNVRSRETTGNAPFDGALDRFTQLDELVERLNSTVDDLNQNVSGLVGALNDQTALDVDVTQSPPAERPYNFTTLIEADTPTNDPKTEVWSIPHDGTVTKVIIGFPDGAQQAAGVGVRGTDGEALIPAGPSGSKFIALNDKTLTFNVDDTVAKEDEYTFRFANSDPDTPHVVNVIPVLSRGG